MRMRTTQQGGGAVAARRWALAGLLLAALAGCGVSTVDEVRVTWPPFKDGTALVLPSDPAQCPDLAGTYRVAGQARAGEAAAGVADLRRFLAYTLDLPDLRDTAQLAWRPTPAARVTFKAAPQGWQVLADDGQGGRFTGLLPLRDVTAGSVRPAHGPLADIQHFGGCTQGRYWISARRDWRQYESMGVFRTVALLRPQAGGLLVSVQRESHSIGLLPWYSSDETRSQFWFGPAGP
ncbi:hypothetical protein LMG26788_01734 [Achromobacter pulmonis]|uniref:Lipoprotein n=2 Tax=Alcaligenaceae TaxID=506 RepID=A0A6S7CJN7_9BURK|nr:hypothetical protein LMG26696_03026 [Achromobacter pulmonis]CAB3850508.1 hypothetical protein LMG26788_01734 [Achromobacter pulmonis]